MYCPNCNSIIPNDAKFCSHCGMQINANNQFNQNPADPGMNQPAQNINRQRNDEQNYNNNAPFSASQGGNFGAQNQYNNYNADNRYAGNGYANSYNNNQYPNNGQYPNMNPGYNANATEDKRSVGFGILSFFFPVLGLIFYLVWKDKYPIKAKGCGIAAIVGVAVGLVAGIIRGILAAVFGGVYYNTYDSFDDYVNLAYAVTARLGLFI